MRARSFASSGSLASSSPVEAQLFIQTRAISSYSSARAGRMVGIIETIPGGQPVCQVAQDCLRRYGKSAGYQLLGGYGISGGGHHAFQQNAAQHSASRRGVEFARKLSSVTA